MSSPSLPDRNLERASRSAERSKTRLLDKYLRCFGACKFETEILLHLSLENTPLLKGEEHSTLDALICLEVEPQNPASPLPDVP